MKRIFNTLKDDDFILKRLTYIYNLLNNAYKTSNKENIQKIIFFIIEDNNNIYEEYLKKTEKINYTDLCLYIDEFKFNFKKVEDFKNNLRELLNYHSKIYEYELSTDILTKLESVPVVAQTKKKK